MYSDGHSAERIARPYIEACRRDLTAAWLQLEAARDLLNRSHWLFERWRAHAAPVPAAKRAVGGQAWQP